MTTRIHDRIYTVLLSVLGLWTLVVNFFTAAIVMHSKGDRQIAFLVDTLVGIFYCIAEITVAVIRVFFPEKRKFITFLLNFALCLFFPIGTVLAIYGFWKVDKRVAE